VNGYAERNGIFVCLSGVDALLCLRLPITQFPSGMVFFFLSFHSRRSRMVSHDISFRVTDKRYRIGISRSYDQMLPTCFRRSFHSTHVSTSRQCRQGQTGPATKVLHVSKNSGGPAWPYISSLLALCFSRYFSLTWLVFYVSRYDGRGVSWR
jgi:hypothetical protein